MYLSVIAKKAKQSHLIIKDCFAFAPKLMMTTLLIIFIHSSIIVYAIGENKKPTFVKADFIEYNGEEDFIYAKGNIQITLDNYILKADSLLYDLEKDLLWAEGDVRIKDEKDRIIFGQTIFFKDKLKSCVISDFIMKFSDNNLLASKLAERLNAEQITLYNSKFTPCSILCNSRPIWQISSYKTEIDFNKERMIYKNLFFELYGVPIFYAPYFSHPTPSAKAKSGILVPSIKKNYLFIPFYIRAKPNMDLTLSPRIFTKYRLVELEARHKINKGDYNIHGSGGRVPYRIKDKSGKVIKDTNIGSYHIFAIGNFYQDDYKYGFNLKRTSDKAYLKNYHNLHDSYLNSKIYLHNVQYGDYLSVEALHFQGLKTNDSDRLDPLILPHIRTKNIFGLNEDDSTFLIIQNDLLSYKEREGTKIDRGSIQLSVTNNSITPSGHLLNISAYNSADIYLVNKVSNNNISKICKKSNILLRDIPEIQTTWRYPLVQHIKSSSSIIIEPIITTIVGKKFKPSYNKFSYIDSNQYELSEDNLFSSNKYSGVDYHEFGNRLSYGINSGLLSNDNYFSLFLGQSLHKYNNTMLTNNAENVGKASLSFSSELEVFYRYRKNKHFSPIRDELGTNFQNDRIQLTAAFIKLENLKKYHSNVNIIVSKNTAKQIYYDVDYQLTPNWLIGNDMRIDLSTKKTQILNKSIKVTYLKDCVRIVGKLSSDYTFDDTRGIRKSSSSFTMSIGLKVLNM